MKHDKKLHELTRQIITEAIKVRSYATSLEPDGVWKHTRRTMRACHELLAHMDSDAVIATSTTPVEPHPPTKRAATLTQQPETHADAPLTAPERTSA